MKKFKVIALHTHKPLNWSYIAGFVDGEGCINICSKKAGIRLQIVNTNKKVLEEIQKFINKKLKSKVGAIYSRNNSGFSYKKIYLFQIANHLHCKYILNKLEPYSIVKLNSIQNGISYIENRKWLNKNITKECLTKLYNKQKLTMREIGKKLQMHPNSIFYLMKFKYNIPRRTSKLSNYYSQKRRNV